MNFWAERWRDLPVPSVQLADIGGRACVAFKEKEDHPTTYIFPIDPDTLRLILDLTIGIYTSVTKKTDSPGSQEARAELLRLTTSMETLPNLSNLSDTQENLGHGVHICIVHGLAENCTP